MNILFVYSLYNIASLRKPLQSQELIQFGISYISAFLKKHGHNTKLLVLSRISGKLNEALCDEYIASAKPAIIAFTAVSTEYEFIQELAMYVKNKYPGIYLVIGGAHVSLNPEGVLGPFDAVCVGEGEKPMLELAEQLKKGATPFQIPNMWIKKGDAVEKNSTRPFIEDLDELPFPDRLMWEEWTEELPHSRPAVMLGRGCVFECAYCSNHALKKLATGTYTRYRSVGNIIQEICAVSAQYPNKKEIYLEVESIGLNKSWAVSLCKHIADFNKTRAQPISFGANLRIMPNLDIETIFAAFKKANFRFINIGLESGSHRIRTTVLNRHYSNDDVINAVRVARTYGLQVSFLNMIGLPTETYSDFKETVGVNRACLPDWVGYSIFYPYPGTKIYNFCKQNNFLAGPLKTDFERTRATLDLSGFSRKQIEQAYLWFEYDIYKGSRPRLALLKRVLSLQIKINPFLFALHKRIKFLLSRLVLSQKHS